MAYPQYKPKQDKIEAMMEKKQQYIRESMDKKTKDIAYFNSLNAAINLVCKHPVYSKFEDTEVVDETILAKRNFYFDEWVKWQAQEEAAKEEQSEDEILKKFDEATSGKPKPKSKLFN